MPGMFVSEVMEMKCLKKQMCAQEEGEPWPEVVEFEPMPSCQGEYHSWRWKI